MLDRLKARNASAVGAYEWNGEPFHLRRMSAGDWVRLQSLVVKAGDEETQGVAGDGMLSFYVEVLAKTLCDANGTCDCDTDEGREQLRLLGIADLTTLGQIALKHNGAKDEEPEKN